MICNCKGPSYAKRVEFTAETTLFDFIGNLNDELKIPLEEICIKKGFPPSILEANDLSVTAFSWGIKNMESILVVSDKENSLYTQAGLIEEEVKEENKEEIKGFEK